MEILSDKRAVILVTGSAGLIGTRVVEAMSGQYKVAGLDLKPPNKTVPGTDFIECDLTADESVDRAIAAIRDKLGDRVASVIHLAAYYDFSGEPSRLYRDLTVEGTRRLLKHLQRFQVEQFVFSSTLLVMKPAEGDETITESSPMEAAWDYPRSKIEAEEVIREERGDIPAVILRIAGVYDEDCHSIPLAQHISRIYERKFESFFYPGDSSRGQPFIHMDDLVDCFRKAVEMRHQLGQKEVFLIAEPDYMSYGELQDRLGELIHGGKWPTIRIPKAVAKAGAWVQEQIAGEEETFIKPWMIDLADAHYPVDITRARERLGWEPKHRLHDALDEVVRRMKSDPARWYRENHLPHPEEEKEASAR